MAYKDKKYMDDYIFHSNRILKVVGDYCYEELKNAEVKLHKHDGDFIFSLIFQIILQVYIQRV